MSVCQSNHRHVSVCININVQLEFALKLINEMLSCCIIEHIYYAFIKFRNFLGTHSLNDYDHYKAF